MLVIKDSWGVPRERQMKRGQLRYTWRRLVGPKIETVEMNEIDTLVLDYPLDTFGVDKLGLCTYLIGNLGRGSRCSNEFPADLRSGCGYDQRTMTGGGQFTFQQK